MHVCLVLVARVDFSWSSRGIVHLELSIERHGNVLSINDATCTEDSHRDEYHQKIELLARTTCKGGSYSLFKCPCCYKARRQLSLSGFFFMCRECAKLTYKSQRERSDARLFRRWEKLSAKLGGVKFGEYWAMRKPKGMHAKTFARLENAKRRARASNRMQACRGSLSAHISNEII